MAVGDATCADEMMEGRAVDERILLVERGATQMALRSVMFARLTIVLTMVIAID